MRRSAIGLEGWKTSLDPIEPRRPRRGEMEVDVWMFLEPAIALLMGVEIIEDDVQLAIREGGNHAVHEAEELDTAPPLGMLGNNPAAGDFERCKQGRGAVPLVIVALAGQGASVRELQVALRPLQRLDRRLLIDRERSPWQAGRYRDRPRRPLSPRTQGHCSRTRTCGQPDRCCARAESAKHIERQHLATPSPAADPSSGRSPAAAAYPEAPECVCSSPDCRLASCLPAGDHSVQQAHDRQSDAAIC